MGLRKREIFSARLAHLVGEDDLGVIKTGEHVHYGDIIINEDKTITYKLDEGHNLVFVSEDKHEATFECQYCRRRIAFALPGSGEPAAHGKPGAWEPDPESVKWMEPCST